MKFSKILSVIISLVMILCSNTTVLAESVQVSYPEGDVNCDGVLNITDLVRLKKQFIGAAEITTSADVNQDSLYNSGDLVRLRKLLLSASSIAPTYEENEEFSVIAQTIKTAEATDNVSINIDISGNPGVMSFVMTVSYDTNAFDFVSCEKQNLNDMISKCDEEKGEIKIVSCEKSNYTYDSTLFSLNFTVTDNALSIAYPIEITQVDFCNFAEKIITPKDISGEIFISNLPIASGTIGDNIIWKLYQDGSLFIDGEGTTKDYDIETELPWVSFSKQIVKITISNTVTRLGDNIFSSLENLLEIHIENPDMKFGSNIVSADTNAIFYCKGGSEVEKYTIANGLTLVKPQNPTAVIEPIISYISNNSVMLNDCSGYEYSIDGKSRIKNNTFENLEFNKVYTVYQRIAEDVYEESAATESKFLIASPPKALAGNTILKIKAKDGYEYSIDGINWQENNIFTDLEANTAYTVYQRPKTDESITFFYHNDGTTVLTNGDDTIENPNSTHLVWLRKSFLEESFDNLAADFNEDFEINLKDLIRLKKKIANIA